MKKIIAVFISLLALPALGEEGLKPITKFNPTDSAIFCQVDISPLKIKSISGYDVITSVDGYLSTDVGKPSLPVHSFFVLLPPETEVRDVTITSVEQVELAGRYNLKPLSPPTPISKGFTTSESIFQDENFYPQNILRLDSTQKLRGYSIACISIFGAGYNPKTQELFWNKQITFKLNLATSKIKAISSTIRGISEDEELVKELVVNPELITTYPRRLIWSVRDTYKYVVITTEALVSAFTQLCASKPMTATIATTSWIYNKYSGNDNQEKIRAFIKYCYKNYGTEYILLGGDVDIIPYRGVYAKVPEGSNLGDYIDNNIPCDLYYACLDGNWNADNDATYGELEDGVDLSPEVWIGRAPVSTPAEAINFVNKIITCEKSQDDYIYNEILIGYVLPPTTCDGKEIMEDIAMQTPRTYTVYKEYETGGGVDNNRIINAITSGVGLIAHANHANWNTALPFNIGSPIDVRTLSNGSKTFVFNTIGCIAGDFSNTSPYNPQKKDCIGEEMLLNQNGGAVAFVGNSRYGWFDETNVKSYSGEYQIEFFKKFFKEGYTRIGETLGKSKMTFISKCNKHTPYRWIMFCLDLLGDPAMEFQTQKGIFCIDQTIDEIIDKPGDIVDLVVTLKNLKEGTVTNVYGTISTTDLFTTIIKDNASFGNIPSGGTSSGSYTIQVNSNCPPIHKVFFQLEIGGDGGYENTDKFSLVINLKVDNLSQVIAYPNPCYPNKGQILKIANIPLNSNPKVYIYNLVGELIRTLDEEGSEIKIHPGCAEAIWDAKNNSGKNVASGIYIYLLKCDVGTKKGKIAIVR
ncbi:MAG: C25 family cysteine peptidase [bacterium]|nr:C25 family cysteine peptidase [bacterium]